MESTLHFEEVFTQPISASWLLQQNVQLNVLRLDTIHPVISGNKWFKLKYYLRDAKIQGYDTVATFGGAYSNHIVAAAFACKQEGLKSIGIIRGEHLTTSHTLFQAREYGMKLHFVSTAAYKNKETIENKYKNVYWINEGGYGYLGAKGAAEILSFCKHANRYTHIVCAVGTGTMLAGLIEAANEDQIVIGISVMKGNYSLIDKTEELVDIEHTKKPYRIMHDFHFGGYAKHPPGLIEFMNEAWDLHQLPTDIVYTAKTFYAIRQMVINNNIPANSNVLMVHSGGLQGNLSLPAKTLSF